MDEHDLDAIVAWGEANPAVRAMILTSTRSYSSETLDIFSDFDVILILTDIQPYFSDRAWLNDFGPLLVMYRDPLRLENGFERSTLVVQYENGLKIDFTLWPVGMLEAVVAMPQLPDEFDAGYRILLDKDGLTDGLKPPTFQSYIPKPPTEAAYLERVELIFHNATYVAKYLWRDDLVAAKHIMEGLRQDDLLPMIVWRSEIDHNWKFKAGQYGRRLKQWIRTDLWEDLAATYVGPGIEENWEALFKTLALFEKVAKEVADLMGFTYPEDMHRRSMGYLEMVRGLDQDADRFPP